MSKRIPLSAPLRFLDAAVDRVVSGLREANRVVNHRVRLSEESRAKLDARLRQFELDLRRDAATWKSKLAATASDSASAKK